MSGLFPSSSSSSTSAAGDITKDVTLTAPPEDGISDLAFSPQSEHLAVASWDKKVRIYEIDAQGGSQGKALFEHEQPVLSCCWSKDGKQVVGAGADKAARMLDLGSGNTTAVQVAAHDQPIRCVRFVDVPNSAGPVLVTGSWDKTVKYWDLRQPTPVASVECQDKIYSMDVKNQLLVIATADRIVNVISLDAPTKFYKTMQSPLKWQTRVVSCFSDATGFAVGSIEGRCAIQYVEEKDASSNFSFKCHRQTPPQTRDISNVYSVNAISFHPVHGTFSTAGSDGTFHFWDKDAKHRLKGYPEVGGTISATCFNRNGNVFAYAVSYDWSKGYAESRQGQVNKVMLHPVGVDECKPRPKVGKR
ncbi:MAG: nuclear pore complex [Lasallia pustulata]|uniref:Nuclear pore complex n=1 Tax=Lasallia pustulata TaxID=136370 RepID=A0A1W5DCP3_9LECA|nr:MAG: nuclear pore complex [Lasallia pustulata]SLM40856.1 nuclear pore complex protein [Lasallia pustulata]